MSATEKILIVSGPTTLLSTELNSLANNALAIVSSAFDNTQAATGDGSLACYLELLVTFGTAPTANTGISIWFLRTVDGGTNFEDGGTSLTPVRGFDTSIGVAASTSAQRLIKEVKLPAGKFKLLLKNDGTGQAFAASGNTIRMTTYTYQAV